MNEKTQQNIIIFITVFLFILMFITGSYAEDFPRIALVESINLRLMIGMTLGCALILLMPMLFIKDSIAAVVLALIVWGTPLSVSAWNTVLFLNGSNDHSQAQALSAKIILKHSSKGRGRDYYFLNLITDSYTKKPVRIEVSSQFFNTVTLHETMHIVVRDGAFGYKWLQSYEKVY